MSYYQLNRPEILKKSKYIYIQRKAAEYYLKNKKAIIKSQKNCNKNLPKEEKDKIKEYQKKTRYQQLIQYKKRSITIQINFVLINIKMNEKTLKFDNIVVNKKEFHKSKQPIDLVLINVDQIVISWKFKRKDVVLIFFWLQTR